MIVSASRRTDIPAFYSEWFFNRLRAGSVCVRNPMDFHRVSEILLTPDAVDGFVFWTKNPTPMLGRLRELGNFPYYFQFTLNAYDRGIEPNLPDRDRVRIPAFRKLAELIGPDRVVWRYDPILLTGQCSPAWHAEHFAELAEQLSGCTKKCVVSFVDLYRNTRANAGRIGLLPFADGERENVARRIAEIAAEHGMTVESCAEAIDLERFGIAHGRCVDARLLGIVPGKPAPGKDKNQRKECGCDASVDIGMYNTCGSGCLYCYANYSPKSAAANAAAHRPDSPLISGGLLPDDIVKRRKTDSIRSGQLTFGV